MSSSVKVDDRAWRKIYNLVRKVDGASVRAGALDGPSSEIATIHEYGAPKAGIPERSFVRSTFRDKRGELVALQAKVAAALIAGKVTESQAMQILGAWAVGAIKATITRDGHFAPLASSTVRAKRSDKALIDTGQLVGAIRFEVVP